MAKKQVITEIEGRRLKLSNLEKTLYPNAEIIKAELIQYYLEIAPLMIPHLKGRPITLIRYPDGVLANRFYSKNKPSWTPQWIASVQQGDEDDENTYIMANEPATLAWIANLATLELHPMSTKANHLNFADHFIFDLDPPENADFDSVKRIAQSLKPFLESYGYHPFIKTSGSKGLHIYVPIVPQYGNDLLMSTIKKLAKEYIRTDDSATLKISKEKRKGKVLLDIYRNHRSQTCVAPYSTRGKIGAPVSTPIFWNELLELENSQAYNLRSVLERVKSIGDPWASFAEYAVHLHDHRLKINPQLSDYEEKRDFSKTTEPDPYDHTTSKKNRYVIQLHDASNLHYDLRLEDNGVLRSWAIPKGLPTLAGIKRLAIETEPHPTKHLDFEGKIPKDEYGGGEMWIFDNGTYEYLKKEQNRLQIRLKDGYLSGEYTFINTEGRQWLVHTDIPNSRINDTHENKPMLASMTKRIPSKSEYFYEIKWDGIRVLIRKIQNTVTIYSRNGNDLTSKFPAIAEAISEQEAQEIIIDGEIVVLNKDGTPNFSKVVGRMHLISNHAIKSAANENVAVLYAFDCIYLDGLDLLLLPIEKRRDWLRVNLNVGEHVRYSDTFEDGKELMKAISVQGMEGIMCKKKNSIYISGKRSKSWLKVKVRKTDKAIIIGYTEGKGDRKEVFGSLHLAKSEGEKLVYYGKVGTGFDHEKMKQIINQLAALKKIAKPISDSIVEENKTTWIQPLYECEIKYASMTNNNTYREPVFLNMTKIVDKISVNENYTDG